MHSLGLKKPCHSTSLQRAPRGAGSGVRAPTKGADAGTMQTSAARRAASAPRPRADTACCGCRGRTEAGGGTGQGCRRGRSGRRASRPSAARGTQPSRAAALPRGARPARPRRRSRRAARRGSTRRARRGPATSGAPARSSKQSLVLGFMRRGRLRGRPGLGIGRCRLVARAALATCANLSKHKHPHRFGCRGHAQQAPAIPDTLWIPAPPVVPRCWPAASTEDLR
jgi:hypothetical protein